ncbi:MAG: sulfatase-like hydrolase/transferase [Elusimicrobiota bacterium]
MSLPLLLWSLLTSAWAALCWSPVSWPLLKTRFVPGWVEGFLGLHLPLFILCVVLARRQRRLFLPVSAAIGLFFIIRPLSGSGNDVWSLAAAFLAWVPLLASGSLPGPERFRIGTRGALICALSVFALHSGAFLVAHGPRGALAALSWSLLLHAVMFLSLSAGLELLALLPVRVTRVLLWLGTALAMDKLLLEPVGVMGPAGILLSLWSTAALCMTARRITASRRASLALLALAFLVACLLPRFDWGRMFRTLWALLTWVGACSLASSREPEQRRAILKGAAPQGNGVPLTLRRRAPVLAALGLSWAALLAAWLLGPASGLGLCLSRHADLEPSFGLARRVFSPAASRAELFALLRRHTHLPKAARIAPQGVALADKIVPGPRPDIFVFVLDSLRQDHVGAYNPEARFTPSLDAFAKENIVFKKAFAVYAGTGLSQPSLWSGSLLPHKQPMQPFREADNLSRLLVGYRRWMSMDVYLREILEPSSTDADLDRGAIGDYKFCRTLRELEERVPDLGKDGPVFVYTRPEDLHIGIINRENRSWSGKNRFPGFYAPYAERVEAMDSCFGRFIAKLKASGRYGNSVIVVTSDHGDSLGEDALWGHAYSLNPNVLRIPLILHVPPSMKSLPWDTDSPAYLTDVTPTLYALLGQEHLREGPLLGRPLFLRKGRPQLAACSYGPVYGLIDERGRRLYVLDGVDYSSRCYDLEGPAIQGSRPCGPRVETEGDARVKAMLALLQRTFGY